MSTANAKHRSYEFTLGDTLVFLRRQWLMLAGIWFLIIAVAVALTCYVSPIFRSHTSLYYSSSVPPMQLGALMNPYQSGNDIETDKQIIVSDMMLNPVILKLGLNTEIEGDAKYLPIEPTFLSWWLNQDVTRFETGLRIVDQEPITPLINEKKFEIRFSSPTEFTLHKRKRGTNAYQSAPAASGTIGSQVTLDNLQFVLSYQGDAIAPGSAFQVELVPAPLVLKDIRSNLGVTGGGVAMLTQNLVTISYKDASPLVARDVVAGISAGYLQLRDQWGQNRTDTIIGFIQNNINRLEERLQESSDTIAKFQKETGLMLVESQIQAEVQKMIEAEREVQNTEIRLMQLETLQKALQSATPEPSLMAFIDDPVIQQLSENLTRLDAEIAELSSEFQPNAMPLRNKMKTRESLFNSLDEIVDEYVARAREINVHAKNLAAEYRKAMDAMPEAAQALAEQARSQKLLEDLYVALIGERQRAELAEASTATDIRVVDEPTLPLEEASPQPLRNGIVGVFGGLILAIMVVMARMVTIRTIQTASELQQHFPETPVFANLPVLPSKFAHRNSPAVLNLPLNSPYMEQIRQLRVNLDNARADMSSQVVLMTSSNKGDGKSTVVFVLASAMAQSQKLSSGVIVIDADIIHPSQDSIMNQQRSPGLTEFLNNQSALGDVIQKVSLPNNGSIDFIAAGSGTPSPVELLETDRMSELLAYCREHYDYVLIDSSPYPSQTLALVLAKYVDRSLMIIRPLHTMRSAMLRAADDLRDISKYFGFIINGARSQEDYVSRGYEPSHGSVSASSPKPAATSQPVANLSSPREAKQAS